MDNEVEFEDGELDSSDLEGGHLDDEESQGIYVPLARPIAPEGLLSNVCSSYSKRDSEDSEEEESALGRDSSSSDSETPNKRRYSSSAPQTPSGGGSLFNKLAREFQASRKKKNNVWGSILQEESLTSELSSIGVSRSQQLPSDRGAESYDYSLASEESKLNRELDDYFKHKPEEHAARRKRSIHDRLGPKNKPKNHQEALDNMSIPPPGVARIIPELSSSLLEKESLPEIAEDLAAKLCEPKTELISGVLSVIGIPHTIKLFNQTRDIEKNGGLMIKSGSRRRTPGGLFLHLLRECKDETLDQRAIKELFNVSASKKDPSGTKLKKNQNFEAELKEFRDIRKQASKPEEGRRTPEPFQEPEAPPNSVERSHPEEEDDDLSCDTLDIELS